MGTPYVEVRDFIDTTIKSDGTTIPFAGEKRGNIFRISINNLAFDLPILFTGTDGLGEFYLVEELHSPLGSGWSFSIESEYDEFGRDGGCCRLVYHPNCETSEIEMASRGVNPEGKIVLAPIAIGFAIYFMVDGELEYVDHDDFCSSHDERVLAWQLLSQAIDRGTRR